MTKDKTVAKAKKSEKEKKVKPAEKAEKAEKIEKPKKVKTQKALKSEETPKSKKSKGHPEKQKRKIPSVPSETHGITSVDLLLVIPDEPASCNYEPSTGLLTLRIPQALDGAPGPQGLQGPQGIQGESAKGLDYSKAPGSADEFFLFIDKQGQLCYSANGDISFVSLIPIGSGEAPME